MLIVLWPLISLGCAHAPEKPVSHARDLLIQDSETMLKPWNLGKAAIAADLELLIYALKTAYGGRDQVPRAQFTAALARLEVAKAQEALTPFEFCRAIDQALLEIQDQHLFPWLIGMSCEEQRSSRKRKVQVGANLQSSRSIPWRYEERTARGKSVGVLAINALPPHEDGVWNGFSAALAQARRTAGLIIDLRGNSGGDEARAKELGRMLYGQEFPTPVQSQVKSQTPETMAILVNNSRFHISAHRRKAEPVPGYLEEREKTALERLRLAESGALPEQVEIVAEQGPPFDPRRGFTGPVYVLIDAECISSCEAILDFLELHPHVKAVGENTGGAIHFGNVGFLVLPRSKVLVKMASEYAKYRDGRFLEGVGHAPAIRVTPGEDAWAAAWRELSR